MKSASRGVCVKEQFFVVGDLVLKWKTNQAGVLKLATPWKGPFMIKEVTRPTSYRLARLDGTTYPIPGTSTSLGVSMLSY